MGLRLQRAATDARLHSPNLLVSPDTCDVPGTPRRNYTHEALLSTNVVEGLSRRQTRAVPLLKTARCTLSTASAVTAPLFWLRPNAPGIRFTPHAGGDAMTVFEFTSGRDPGGRPGPGQCPSRRCEASQWRWCELPCGPPQRPRRHHVAVEQPTLPRPEQHRQRLRPRSTA